MENKIKGSSILITGANGGMGLETVRILAQKGAKRIALACRTLEKAKVAIDSVEAGDTILEPFGGFDMLDHQKIKEAVKQLPKEEFDMIFLQSGGMVVADAFQFVNINGKQIEKTVQQNAIGALQTVLYLEEAGLVGRHARIVFAGGEGARGLPGAIRKPEFKSMKGFAEYLTNATGKYVALDAIGVSKFASALIVQKLAERDRSRSYVWFSPGLTGGTKGLDSLKNPKKFIMKRIGFPLMQVLGIAQSPKQAAEKYVSALNSEIGSSGDLIGAPEGKALGTLVDQKPMNPSLTNHQLIDGFWKLINDIYTETTNTKSVRI